VPASKDSSPASNIPCRTKLHVDKDLPIFEGHFPDHPLVPAAMQLEWMLAALPDDEKAVTQWTVQSAKFLKPLAPGDDANIVVSRKDNAFRVEISNKDGLHAHATIRISR